LIKVLEMKFAIHWFSGRQGDVGQWKDARQAERSWLVLDEGFWGTCGMLLDLEMWPQ
jgi:hypothetical protein